MQNGEALRCPIGQGTSCLANCIYKKHATSWEKEKGRFIASVPGTKTAGFAEQHKNHKPMKNKTAQTQSRGSNRQNEMREDMGRERGRSTSEDGEESMENN